MATLRAHGREFARVERNGMLDSGTPYRETVALMQDGCILRKVDFRGTYPHSTGWKKTHRRVLDPTPDVATKWADAYAQQGWVKTVGRAL